MGLVDPSLTVSLQEFRVVSEMRALPGLLLLFLGLDLRFAMYLEVMPIYPAWNRALLPEAVWPFVINSLVKA